MTILPEPAERREAGRSVAAERSQPRKADSFNLKVNADSLATEEPEPVPAANLKTEVGGSGWRDHLRRLEGLGLVLLPIGAGSDRKGPVDPRTGNGLKRWQQHPGFPAAEIGAMNPEHVIGAGLHTGPSGLDVLDLDGLDAVHWVAAHDVDPRDPALFRITRTTDPDRFKIPFRLTPEQRERLPKSKLLLRVGEQAGSGKGHAVELYGNTGAQVVALGHHAKSGGWYDWAGDPSMIGPPSEAWMQVLISLHEEVQRLRSLGDSSRPPTLKGYKVSGKWQGSSYRNPCPVCGRDHSSACTRTTVSDGRVLVSCYHGGNFSPPEVHKRGQKVPGKDGGTWGYIRTYVAKCLGDKSFFIQHRDREPDQVLLAPRSQQQSASPQVEEEPPHDPKTGQEGASGGGDGGKAPPPPSSDSGGPAPEPEPLPYGDLIARALEAIKDEDEDAEMAIRAELKTRFRVSDEQISTALFKRHSLDQVAPKQQTHDSVDLDQVAPLDYILDGWIPRGDIALTYGPAGTGKTTLALAKAYAHITGRNLLDRNEPCEPGRALFIATDSGPAALKKAMHDLGIDPATDPLLQPGHPDQRLWVWAHEPEQGHRAWLADIHGVIRLEKAIREKGITYVVIDSAKAVSAAAGWSYTSNESVKALLQYLREGVAMPTGACLEFLSHDGTEKGSHSGAKAWAEDPSMVCALELAIDPESKRPEGIRAQFKKDRAAHITPRRTVTYSLVEGELVLHPDQEVVGSCAEAILTILWDAYQRGVESVSGGELRAEASIRFDRSHKTVENTLGKIAGTGKGPKPTPVIRPKRGRYALAPAEIERRTSRTGSPNRGGGEMGGVYSKPIPAQGVWSPPIETPTGGSGGLGEPPKPPPGEVIGETQTTLHAWDLPESPPGRGMAPPYWDDGDDDPHWGPRREWRGQVAA